MPLMISGVVNGVNYQDQIIKAEDAAQMFGIKIPDKNEVRFFYTEVPSRPNNGSGLVRPGANVLFSVTAVYQGIPINIRYFETKVQKPGSFIPEYRPRKFVGFRHGEVVRKNDSLEKLVFLLLTPQNADSPMDGGSPLFKTDRPEEKAAKKMQSIRGYQKILVDIESMSHHDLLVKGKGLKVNTPYGVLTPPIFDDMETDELKVHILEVAEKDQDAFVAAWYDARTGVRGSLRQLMDDNLVVATKSGGQTVVAWRSVNGNAEILRYMGDREPVDALLEFCLQPQNQVAMKQAIENAVGSRSQTIAMRNPEVVDGLEEIRTASGRLSAHLLKKKENSVEELEGMKTEQVLAYCLDNQLLWYNIPERKIYRITNGEPDGVIYESSKTGKSNVVAEYERIARASGEERTKLLDIARESIKK